MPCPFRDCSQEMKGTCMVMEYMAKSLEMLIEQRKKFSLKSTKQLEIEC